MSESKFEEFPYGELGIIAMKNIEGLAKEVDELLMKKNGATESYLLKITESRFSNGEGKVTIDESVRGRDILIISDVGNYGLKYNMFGEQTIIVQMNTSKISKELSPQLMERLHVSM